ncbi:restriction endonuclease subunit S [Psychrobacter sp. AH5]|uniref:restriction endonuclease subunit S n=1 Tax=Psychrobacter sp. AH5 TaxID=2937433 RepID=UPI00334226A4
MAIYNDYKATQTLGFESIPYDWEIKKVKYLFSIGRGRVIAQEELMVDGLYPVYSSQTQNNGCLGYINSFDFDCDQLTWTTDGANAGTIFIRSGKHNCTNVCGTLQLKGNLTSLDFIYYALQYAAQFYKRPDTNGAKIMNNEMAEIGLATPSILEQQKIIGFLDHETAQIDTLIEKQQTLIQLLKEKRQAVISHAVTKGLNPDAPMKDSGVEWLGDVPEHWDIMPAKRFFKLVAEPAPSNNDYELLSVYTAIGVRPRKDLEQKGNKASTTDGYWKVEKGDIVVNKLLAWMGAVGYSDYEGVTSPAYDILRATKDINSKFYHYLFRTKLANMEFKRWSRGIMEMRLRLYFDELGRIFMPLPSKKEQDLIVKKIEKMDNQFDNLIKKSEYNIQLMQERRTALISAAVTGKIDVRGWRAPE